MFDDDGGGKFLSFFIEILSAEDRGVDCLLGKLFTGRFNSGISPGFSVLLVS